MLFWAKAWSAGRFIRRLLGLWPLFWRVCFALIAISYGSLWLWAEIVLSTAVTPPPHLGVKFSTIRRAASIFPLDYVLRAEAANAAINLSGLLPPQIVFREVNDVLKNDPYSTGWLRDREILLHAIQDNEAKGTRK
jgi:hypothetical protein